MAVHRSRWTDERLDDLAERVVKHDVLEVRMDALERSLADFRDEMREFRGEMREFRREITSEVRELRSEVFTTKRWMTGFPVRSLRACRRKWFMTLV